MSKPLDFFHYQDGALHAEDVPLERIADEIGTPAYVYSAEALLSPLRELQEGLKGIGHRVCFAVKSNSNLSVLRLLAEAGAGLDLVSGGELYRAGAARVAGERIVFSGVGKTPGEMAQALEYRGSGIFSFNVESVSELEVLSAVAQDLGKKKARVALRFNPDVNPKTHPYISTGLKKNKFGMNRKEIVEVARAIADFSGVELNGLSIHIGSQLLSLSPIEDAFARVRELAGELDRILPEPLAFVDLGGGVGITYKNEKSPPLKKYCALIRKYFGPRAKGTPRKILVEPGRRIAGNSGVLLTEVLYRKPRQSKDFLIVDAAMNDLIRPALYESYHEIVPVDRKKAAGRKRETDIVGPVCETGDCFASERAFPAKVGPGDLVAILSAGAYGFTMASNYNSRPRPPEVLVRGNRFEIIRLRESYEDLIRGE